MASQIARETTAQSVVTLLKILSKSYGEGAQRLKVLQSISLEIREGEFVGRPVPTGRVCRRHEYVGDKSA